MFDSGILGDRKIWQVLFFLRGEGGWLDLSKTFFLLFPSIRSSPSLEIRSIPPPPTARVQVHIFQSCGSVFFLGGGGNFLGVQRSDLSMIIICQQPGFDSYWVVLSCDAIYHAIQGGSNI